MIQHIKEESGKIKVTHTRENWKEWFRFFKVIHEVGEGGCYPRFYLPVYRDYPRGDYMCWIIPLAPFVLVTVAIKRALYQVWCELISIIDKWQR